MQGWMGHEQGASGLCPLVLRSAMQWALAHRGAGHRWACCGGGGPTEIGPAHYRHFVQPSVWSSLANLLWAENGNLEVRAWPNAS